MLWYWIQSTFTFLIPHFDWGKNVVIFGLDSYSSAHTDHGGKKKILGEGPTQGLDNITITRSRNIFCLRLHYNGSSSFCMLIV